MIRTVQTRAPLVRQGMRMGDCPDFRVNKNGTVPFDAGRIPPDTRIRTGPRMAATIAGLILLFAASAQGQDWARKMVAGSTTFDFGTVARGAKAEHRFAIENIYEETAHIKSITSTCQCSKPTVDKRFLKTWEKTELVVTLDTRAEPGRKDGTIEVEFDLPFPAKLQFHVHSFIRGDVVVQPGAVAFGSVDQGAGASRELKITYAGRDDWQIKKVECANPYIKARAVETSRIRGTPAKIAYGLSVELKKDAPPGYIREPLVLVTNDLDTRSARVPVNIEGLVAAALTVRPESLTMGVAEIGKPVTYNLVVRGHAPFRILAIRSSDDRFEGKLPKESKLLHIIPVTFLAKDAKTPPGKVGAKIRIDTDLAGAQPIEIRATIEVVPEK
jgi:hypothetical protein